MHDHLAKSARCGAMASALTGAGLTLAGADRRRSARIGADRRGPLGPSTRVRGLVTAASAHGHVGPRSSQNRVHGLLAIRSGPTVSDSAVPCRIRPQPERGSPVRSRLVGSRRRKSFLTSRWRRFWENRRAPAPCPAPPPRAPAVPPPRAPAPRHARRPAPPPPCPRHAPAARRATAAPPHSRG